MTSPISRQPDDITFSGTEKGREKGIMGKPKVGDRFTHKTFLNPNTGKPLDCKVTAVRAGLVYFRPYYGLHEDDSEWLGDRWYLPLQKWGN